MRDRDLLNFLVAELLLLSYHHMLVERQSPTPNPITMMMVMKTKIGEPSESH